MQFYDNFENAERSQYLNYEVLQDSIGSLPKMQYGVKITWAEPRGKDDSESMTYAFDTKGDAERFAALYDPVNHPSEGAAKVEMLSREAIEVYADWGPLNG